MLTLSTFCLECAMRLETEMSRLVLIGLVVFLSGCLGDHGRMGDVNVEPKPTYAPQPTVTPDQFAKSVEEIKTTVQSSTNAAQQSFSGLGAQIAKGAENVEASVAKVQADVRVNAQANAEANVAIKGEVKTLSDIILDLEVDVNTAINVTNQIHTNVKAQAQVLAHIDMAAGAEFAVVVAA